MDTSILADVGDGFNCIAPKTKEHLAVYIATVLNVKLSYYKHCDNHKSQIDIVWDIYSESEDFMIVHGMRGGGKTFVVAISSFLESVFKPGCGISVLGGSLEQSLRCVAYLNDMWKISKIPTNLLVNNSTSGRGFKMTTGSWVTALAASSKSTRGPHPAKLRIDEADELDRIIYEASLGQPKAKGNIKDNIVVSSTLHKPFGLMSEIIDEREKIGAKLYQFCVEEVRKPLGFYSSEELDRKKRQLTKAMWEAEYLLKRPKIGDSIFDFESVERSYRRGLSINLQPNIKGEAGIDFGYTCTILHIIQDMKEYINVPESYPYEYIELTERCAQIVDTCIEKKVNVIYCDSNPKDSHITLKKIIKKKRAPITVIPVAFSKWKEISINVIRFYLEKDLLNIKDKTFSDKMKKYHFKDAEKEIIDKVDDHYPDALIAWASSRWKILGNNGR